MRVVHFHLEIFQVGLFTESGANYLSVICNFSPRIKNVASLVNQDVNLSILAYLQGGIDQAGDLLKIHNTSLAEDCLGANLLDLLDNILGAPLAALGDIVDDDVGTTLGQLEGNTGTDATEPPSAICNQLKKAIMKVHTGRIQ